MIRLASDNSPVDIAWAAFDDAAIELHGMYEDTRDEPELASCTRAERMAKAAELVRLWDAWRALFLGNDGPRPAA